MKSIPDSHWVLRCDGGARGNPGPAAYGYVLSDPYGREVEARGQYLGAVTNNVPTQVLGESFVKNPATNAAGATALATTGNPLSPALAVGLVLGGLGLLGAARHASGRRLEAGMRRTADRER